MTAVLNHEDGSKHAFVSWHNSGISGSTTGLSTSILYIIYIIVESFRPHLRLEQESSKGIHKRITACNKCHFQKKIQELALVRGVAVKDSSFQGSPQFLGKTAQILIYKMWTINNNTTWSIDTFEKSINHFKLHICPWFHAEAVANASKSQMNAQENLDLEVRLLHVVTLGCVKCQSAKVRFSRWTLECNSTPNTPRGLGLSKIHTNRRCSSNRTKACDLGHWDKGQGQENPSSSVAQRGQVSQLFATPEICDFVEGVSNEWCQTTLPVRCWWT